MKKFLQKLKCKYFNKHSYKFVHAFPLNHTIFLSFKCEHCGKEETIESGSLHKRKDLKRS